MCLVQLGLVFVFPGLLLRHTWYLVCTSGILVIEYIIRVCPIEAKICMTSDYVAKGPTRSQWDGRDVILPYTPPCPTCPTRNLIYPKSIIRLYYEDLLPKPDRSVFVYTEYSILRIEEKKIEIYHFEPARVCLVKRQRIGNESKQDCRGNFPEYNARCFNVVAGQIIDHKWGVALEWGDGWFRTVRRVVSSVDGKIFDRTCDSEWGIWWHFYACTDQVPALDHRPLASAGTADRWQKYWRRERIMTGMLLLQ